MIELKIEKIENTNDVKIQAIGFDFAYILSDTKTNRSVLTQKWETEGMEIGLQSFDGIPKENMPNAVKFILDGFISW